MKRDRKRNNVVESVVQEILYERYNSKIILGP